MQNKKKIGKDSILDRSGSTELAANLFRITQTDDKITEKRIYGQQYVNETHTKVGEEVRNAIKKIGGTMPENLPPEKHIKEIEKQERIVLKKKGQIYTAQ